jgi:hypothetical protein
MEGSENLFGPFFANIRMVELEIVIMLEKRFCQFPDIFSPFKNGFSIPTTVRSWFSLKGT